MVSGACRSVIGSVSGKFREGWPHRSAKTKDFMTGLSREEAGTSTGQSKASAHRNLRIMVSQRQMSAEGAEEKESSIAGKPEIQMETFVPPHPINSELPTLFYVPILMYSTLDKPSVGSFVPCARL